MPERTGGPKHARNQHLPIMHSCSASGFVAAVILVHLVVVKSASCHQDARYAMMCNGVLPSTTETLAKGTSLQCQSGDLPLASGFLPIAASCSCRDGCASTLHIFSASNEGSLLRSSACSATAGKSDSCSRPCGSSRSSKWPLPIGLPIKVRHASETFICVHVIQLGDGI